MPPCHVRPPHTLSCAGGGGCKDIIGGKVFEIRKAILEDAGCRGLGGPRAAATGLGSGRPQIAPRARGVAPPGPRWSAGPLARRGVPSSPAVSRRFRVLVPPFEISPASSALGG